MQNLNELLILLQLEKLSDCIFLGQNYLTPWKRVFGGQVIAQSLSAAIQTVDEQKIAHSLHCYFLLPGNIDIPIVYEVEKIRNGGSFSTRRVVAKQNGIAIFFISISFQKIEEGYSHQIEMPNVPPPEELLSDLEIISSFKEFVPIHYFDLIKGRPFEFRMVEGMDKNGYQSNLPYRNFWFKTKENVTGDFNVHLNLLAYVSDYNLMTTALLPHSKIPFPKNVFMASLDHAMWFHRDFRIDDWLLYAIDSPSASNARGLSRGNIFDKNGRLVASVVQEGLIRPIIK